MSDIRDFIEDEVGLDPVFDRVVLRRDDPYQEAKDSGIIIPEGTGSYMDRLNLCTVLGIGPDCVSKVKVGDRVVIGKYAGTEFQVWGVDVVVIREEEILCLVKSLKSN